MQVFKLFLLVDELDFLVIVLAPNFGDDLIVGFGLLFEAGNPVHMFPLLLVNDFEDKKGKKPLTSESFDFIFSLISQSWNYG